MQRLQKEASAEIQNVEQSAERKVEEVRAEFASRLGSVNEEIEAALARIEEESAARVDELMTETRSLQEWLESHLGQPSPRQVRIASLNRDLLNEGETITREHLQQLTEWAAGVWVRSD